MANLQFLPTSGIDNASRDDSLVTEQQRFFRDIVNADVTPEGNIQSRQAFNLVPSTKGIVSLWQNPVNNEVWSTDTNGMLYRGILKTQVTVVGSNAQYTELNGQTAVLASGGLFVDGVRVTIEEPPAPTVTVGSGSLPQGIYAVAVSVLNSSDMESPLSDIRHVNVPRNGSLTVTGGDVVYVSHPNGEELFAVDVRTVSNTTELGKGKRVMFGEHMVFGDGKYLKYWKGRLVVAQGNVLKFSDALAYHVMSVYDFVPLAQRITFIQPSDFGLWVGMESTVAFITGSSLAEMQLSIKDTPRPVEGSAIRTETGEVVWLSEQGYCIGSADGQVKIVHRDHIKGINNATGSSVELNKRLYSVVH